MFLKRSSLLAFVATLFALAATAPSAKAEFIITITQDASGLTTAGAGSIDTTDLILTPYGGTSGAIFFPSIPVIGVGGDASALEYTGLTTDIPSFGSAVFPSATSQSGDDVAINGRSGGSLFVPTGYDSGSALSGTAFYAGDTLADFGLTLGETYTASWGSGPDADSFVITTAAPVPEPVSVWMLALGGVLLGGIALGKKLKDSSPARAI